MAICNIYLLCCLLVEKNVLIVNHSIDQRRLRAHTYYVLNVRGKRKGIKQKKLQGKEKYLKNISFEQTQTPALECVLWYPVFLC